MFRKVNGWQRDRARCCSPHPGASRSHGWPDYLLNKAVPFTAAWTPAQPFLSGVPTVLAGEKRCSAWHVYLLSKTEDGRRRPEKATVPGPPSSVVASGGL